MNEMDCAVRTSWWFCTSSVDVGPGTQFTLQKCRSDWENWTGDVGPVTLTSKTRCSLRSRMQEWRGVGDVEVGRWKGGDGRTSPRLREGEVRMEGRAEEVCGGALVLVLNV